MKKLIEDARNLLNEFVETPKKGRGHGRMPDRADAIHHHIADHFNGMIHKGEGHSIEMSDGSHVKLRAGAPEDQPHKWGHRIRTPDHARMAKHLKHHGWEKEHQGYGEHTWHHPDYKHRIHSSMGWSGERELKVNTHDHPYDD